MPNSIRRSKYHQTNDQFQDDSVHSTSSCSTSCFPSSIQFILSIHYFYPFCMRLGCLSACMRVRTNKPSLWFFALAEVAASTYTTKNTPFTAHLLRWIRACVLYMYMFTIHRVATKRKELSQTEYHTKLPFDFLYARFTIIV